MHMPALYLCSTTIAGMWENTLVSLLKAMQPPVDSICMSMTASIRLPCLWKRDRLSPMSMTFITSLLCWFPVGQLIPVSKWLFLKKTINTSRGLYPISTIQAWDLYSPSNTYAQEYSQAQYLIACLVIIKECTQKNLEGQCQLFSPFLGKRSFEPDCIL